MKELQRKTQLQIKPEEYLKDKSQLPPHITIDQYRQLRQAVIKHWEIKKKFSKNYQYIVNRDILLIDYMWETGGRIGDIVNITMKEFEKNTLHLYTKKRNKPIDIDISFELKNDTYEFVRKFNIEDKIFSMTIQRAWQLVRLYAKDINFPEEEKQWKNKIVKTTLRPHLFRHGMAINLLNQGVSIPVISARLGHSSTKTTQDMYLKVTAEIQHQHLQNIIWR